MIYPIESLKIPIALAQRNGPFEEFSQDVAVVSVSLDSGKCFDNVILLYPNYVIAVSGYTELPFNPSNVNAVWQKDKKNRAYRNLNCYFWYDSNKTIV
jgi:hypothetical protein